MLRYDTHVHMNELAADADAFIAQLDAGGMTGANVFSVPPPSYIFTKETAEYEERIRSLLAVTQKYPDRLFPSLFIHPDEDGILSKIEDAAGVPEEQLRKAAKMAVCKINVDSDGRLVMTATIRKIFAEKPSEFDPRKYLGPAREELTKMYAEKNKNVFGSAGRIK